MKEISVMEESCYNLRSKFRLHVLRVSTTKYGLETVSSEVVKSGMPFLMTLKARNESPASNVKVRPGMGQAVSATYVAN